MRAHLKAMPSVTRSAHAVFVAGLVLLSSCTGGQSIVPGEGSSSKEESSDDDDKPDQSAPVSGAYLTCFVPTPKDTDEYIVGGCQVRDKTKNRMDMSKNNNVKWGFLGPKGVQTQHALAIFDLSHAKTQRFFDAVYQLKIPPKSAAGLTQTESRNELGRYFLNSVPILTTKLTLLSQARKQGATNAANSLGLTQEQNEDSFGVISPRFQDKQHAPTTPQAMLNTSSTGTVITDEPISPVELAPEPFDSPEQAVQPENEGEYVISGEQYEQTPVDNGGQETQANPFDSFGGDGSSADAPSSDPPGDGPLE